MSCPGNGEAEKGDTWREARNAGQVREEVDSTSLRASVLVLLLEMRN
ncbi:MAG: hypothetical protein QW579_05240 [Desulfurococcaceae archaeon]